MDAIRTLIWLVTWVNGKSNKYSVSSYSYCWCFVEIFSSWAWQFYYVDILKPFAQSEWFSMVNACELTRLTGCKLKLSRTGFYPLPASCKVCAFFPWESYYGPGTTNRLFRVCAVITLCELYYVCHWLRHKHLNWINVEYSEEEFAITIAWGVCCWSKGKLFSCLCGLFLMLPMWF